MHLLSLNFALYAPRRKSAIAVTTHAATNRSWGLIFGLARGTSATAPTGTMPKMAKAKNMTTPGRALRLAHTARHTWKKMVHDETSHGMQDRSGISKAQSPSLRELSLSSSEGMGSESSSVIIKFMKKFCAGRWGAHDESNARRRAKGTSARAVPRGAPCTWPCG